jgi:hypothetical protein
MAQIDIVSVSEWCNTEGGWWRPISELPVTQAELTEAAESPGSPQEHTHRRDYFVVSGCF